MTSTIVCVYICTVCTEHYPFRCGRPSCRRYALLDGFFKCIGQTMPAIAIVIESVEASVRSELDTKAWDISPTHVKVGIDEPGLELWGKVMSPCTQSEIELNFRMIGRSEKKPVLTNDIPMRIPGSKEKSSIPSEVDAIYLVDWLPNSHAMFNVLQRIGQFVTRSIPSAHCIFLITAHWRVTHVVVPPGVSNKKVSPGPTSRTTAISERYWYNGADVSALAVSNDSDQLQEGMTKI